MAENYSTGRFSRWMCEILDLESQWSGFPATLKGGFSFLNKSRWSVWVVSLQAVLFSVCVCAYDAQRYMDEMTEQHQWDGDLLKRAVGLRSWMLHAGVVILPTPYKKDDGWHGHGAQLNRSKVGTQLTLTGFGVGWGGGVLTFLAEQLCITTTLGPEKCGDELGLSQGELSGR